MSLFKQVSILLLLVFSILFILIVNISFNIMRDSSQQSLYENVQNSVSNISLSITNASVDTNTIKTVINASFDNGNYEKIVFKDLDENVVFEREKEKNQEISSIPSWFLNFVSIAKVSSLSTISKGWSVLGTLEVYANRDVYYLQLYKIFITLSITLSCTFLIFLVLIFFVFKSMLKPLSLIKKQSDGIINNEFIFQKEIPFTSEFKSVTISINTIVEKIQEMFNHANEIMKKNKELSYGDELTKLFNRKYFLLKVGEYLDENSVNHRGFLVSVVLTRIDLLNKKIGYENVDKLFIQIAQQLTNQKLNNDSSLIFRTSASEFVFVLPQEKEYVALDIAKNIFNSLKPIVSEIEDKNIKLHLGVCRYKEEKKPLELLNKVEYTLSQAKILQDKEYFYLEDNEGCEAENTLREIISNSKEKDIYKLLYRDVLNIETKKVVFQTISFNIEKDGQFYSYGEFITSVIELGLLNDVFYQVIEKVFNLEKQNEKISIQLPSKFFQEIDIEKIKELLQTNDMTNHIIFEIEEEAFVKYYKNTMEFLNYLDIKGYGISIFNFLGISDDYSYLQIRKIEYIKLNKKFLVASDNIDAINMIKTTLGIKLIVTSVSKEEQLELLKANNIKLVAGKVVESIKKD